MGNSSMTVDGQYEVLVFSARSLAGARADADFFSPIYNGVVQQFDMSKRHNLLSTGKSYRSALSTPPDWCAPSSRAGWSSNVFTKKQSTNLGGSTEVWPPRLKVLLHRWMLRVLDADMPRALESPKAVNRVLPQLKLLTPTTALCRQGVMKHALTLASQSSVAQLPTVQVTASSTRLAQAASTETAMVGHAFELKGGLPDSPSSTVKKVPVIPGGMSTILRPDILAAKIGLLNNTATSHYVTSESLKLTFEFYLLEIARP